MRFTIITNKPEHHPPQSSYDFLPPGGTIGRGVDNHLVLPDNDRTISRLQAIIHISAQGECRITNRGSVTRVVLNDIPLERGRQVALQDGDILGIDEYRLLVNAVSTAQPAPVSRPEKPPERSAQMAECTAAVPSEIWETLAKEFSISDSISASRMKPVALTDDHPLTTPQAENRNPEDLLAQLQARAPLNLERRSQTPDALCSHDGLFKSDSICHDATPTTLAQPVAVKVVQPQAGELDPLALFGGDKPAPAQLNSDDPHGLMMDGAVPLAHPDEEDPAARSVMTRPAVDAQPARFGNAGNPARSPLFAEDVSENPEVNDKLLTLNLDASSAALADVSNAAAEEALSASPLFADLPADKPASLVPAPLPHQEKPRQEYGGITLPTPQAVPRSVTPPPKGRLRIDPVATTSHQQHTSSDGEALQGELLQALLDGMGLNDMQPTPHFNRDNMQQLGEMLGMFSQGTVALLSSRSILKRGVKADMTVILDDANNPFKLLPSGKTVLMQMFGSRMPGFMPPKQAVRDALVDLQAHQLGMIAGIRAIIAAMLQSFNPQQLEEVARQEGLTSRLSLPGSRKAVLWELFNRRYNETAGEIEDDFHTLFGEAFLHAYDMEVNQYKDSQTASDE